MDNNSPADTIRGADRGAIRGAVRGAFRGAVQSTSVRTPSVPFSPVLPGKTNGTQFGFLSTGTDRGAVRGALRGADRGAPWTAAEIISRLEEAGTALIALPMTGYSTQLRTTKLDMIRSALEGYGWESATGEQTRLRPPAPDSQQITRMDEALGWIPLIPLDKYVLRRIVGARALISPRTERHIYPWRRLGTLLGADHKAIQRWHAQGIGLIVTALNGR